MHAPTPEVEAQNHAEIAYRLALRCQQHHHLHKNAARRATTLIAHRAPTNRIANQTNAPRNHATTNHARANHAKISNETHNPAMTDAQNLGQNLGQMRVPTPANQIARHHSALNPTTARTKSMTSWAMTCSPTTPSTARADPRLPANAGAVGADADAVGMAADLRADKPADQPQATNQAAPAREAPTSQSIFMHTNFHVIQHPLIEHKLARLRDKSTGHPEFRQLVMQLAGLMVCEATRSLPTRDIDISTPVQPTRAKTLAKPVTIVPILRAGLVMAEGILSIMPEARVGHLGLARNEHTLEPSLYLERLPKDAASGPVLVLDPMLATGGSLIRGVSVLTNAGVTDICVLSLVAAPEGVENFAKAFPNVRVFAAALDERLNEKGFIVPGLGDAGDRLFGTT